MTYSVWKTPEGKWALERIGDKMIRELFNSEREALAEKERLESI